MLPAHKPCLLHQALGLALQPQLTLINGRLQLTAQAAGLQRPALVTPLLLTR